VTDGRLVLDVSTLARWTGPPVGIVRVEHALAHQARAWRTDASFAFHDPQSGLFHGLDPRWAPVVTGWDGAVEMFSRTRERGQRRWLPSRYGIVMGLERTRLLSARPLARRAAGGAQRVVLALRRHAFPVESSRGTRIANVPFEIALGGPTRLGPEDVMLSAGTDWLHKNVQAIAAMKRRDGFRYAVLCYDMIPLTHPEFFHAHDVEHFRDYWDTMWRTADLVVFNARQIEADARRIFGGLPAPNTAVAPLGYDPPASEAEPPALPGALEPGRYALFVSTIEPRKGHALLLRAWQRLLDRGLPQRHGFRLVFVGRAGWKVDAVLQQLAAPGAFGSTVLHLQGIDDAALEGLYRGAAFCLYPSLYEGFGLPVIEAFAHGKAVLASTGGALPETVGGLSPCLDPADEAAWDAALADWIEHPEHRAPFEAAIRDGFRHPDWATAAESILNLAFHAPRRQP